MLSNFSFQSILNKKSEYGKISDGVQDLRCLSKTAIRTYLLKKILINTLTAVSLKNNFTKKSLRLGLDNKYITILNIDFITKICYHKVDR